MSILRKSWNPWKIVSPAQIKASPRIILSAHGIKNKTVFLLGDYDADLSKYEQHSPTNEF